MHRESEPYLRERAGYERLRKAGAAKILNFNVPQFIRADDQLRIIEMTIVTRPFVLDFADAYLDAPPEFSDEIWAEWEAGKREQFDELAPQPARDGSLLSLLAGPIGPVTWKGGDFSKLVAHPVFQRCLKRPGVQMP